MARIIILLTIIISVAAYQLFSIGTEEPPMVSGTVLRVDSILHDFDRYNLAVSVGADAETIEEAANRVMAIFWNAFETDWLSAMEIELASGRSIDGIVELIGSRVAYARSIGDTRYEEVLERAYRDILNSRNEVWEQILRKIHSNIEYFENH